CGDGCGQFEICGERNGHGHRRWGDRACLCHGHLHRRNRCRHYAHLWRLGRWWGRMRCENLLGRWSSLQLQVLLVQWGHKGLDQGNALSLLLRAAHRKSVVTMLLVFRRLLSKCAAKAFTKLQLSSGPSRVEIGKTFAGQVFHSGKKFLELSCATSEIINHG